MHDGFTLADLFSYNEKHNEANGEDNRDGSNDNHSNNCGHRRPDRRSGKSSALRRQLRKNLLACLMLAQGMPLILAGDEVGNSQSGNNNAYCQDNEVGWVGWDNLGNDGDDMIDFVAQLTDIRRRFPQLRSHRWLDGRREDGLLRRAVADARRRRNDGERLEFPGRPVPLLCDGADGTGQRRIFIVLNAAPEEIAFKLPKMPEYKSWQQILNTDRRQADHGRLAARERQQGAAALRARFRGARMKAVLRARSRPRTASRSGCGRRRATCRSAARQTPRDAAPAGRLVCRRDRRPARRQHYKFRIDDEIDVPDPASAFQPDDVFGPSEVIDHDAFAWRAGDWRGRPWEETVLIETHVGTFTRKAPIAP